MEGLIAEKDRVTFDNTVLKRRTRETSGLARNHVMQMALLRGDDKMIILFSKTDREVLKQKNV